MINDVDEKNVYLDLEKVPLKSERRERRKKFLKRFLIFLLCVFFFILGTFTGYLVVKNLHPSYSADPKNAMGEIEYIFDKYWLYANDYEDLEKEMEDKALYGMTSFAQDPYTTYMSAEESNEFSSVINMNYVGIGVEYSYSDGVALIKRVFKDSPAEKAGVMAGDIIKAVDGVSIEGMTSDQIKERVIGEADTEVVITVSRVGESIDIPIIRGAVDSTVYAYRVDDYVIMELNSFGVDTADRCITYLDQYTDLHKIIIDMRDNSGGYQSSVKEISGLFIGNEQVYLRERDSRGIETVDVTSAKKTYDNFTDIVLLVNENTASAAEVLTICLKEQHPNVTIVGTTTYGKGVIQTNRLLSNDGVLKLTAYYWYSPNGVSIDKVGIKPDIEVKNPDVYYELIYYMQDDEKYEYDSVGDPVRIAQKVLEYLDYDLDRTDGYFDQSFAEALTKFKVDNELDPEPVLDAETFEAIISGFNRELALNDDKDVQLNKAKEVLNGN